jgi:hypothetical protein
LAFSTLLIPIEVSHVVSLAPGARTYNRQFQLSESPHRYAQVVGSFLLDQVSPSDVPPPRHLDVFFARLAVFLSTLLARDLSATFLLFGAARFLDLVLVRAFGLRAVAFDTTRLDGGAAGFLCGLSVRSITLNRPCQYRSRVMRELRHSSIPSASARSAERHLDLVELVGVVVGKLFL